MITRRTFLKYTGGTVLTLFMYNKFGIRQAIAAIEGGSLDPGDVDKFQTPLLIPPVMPKAGKIKQTGGQNVDYYEISIKQFQQQILPTGHPATTVWGYGAVAAASKRGLLLHHAPSFTFEARQNRPVRIKWINDLLDADGNYLPHLLPVDPTLHWANPPGGTAGRDQKPSFAGKSYVETTSPTDPVGSNQYTRYWGPVPMVTHVHGAIDVGDESDGYGEAWYLSAADNIPAGYATEGTWYDFFKDKALNKFGVTWGPGFAIFQYPNPERPCTDWYHDHTLGMTRLNVYAGPAGFYIIRGGPGGDGDILDSRSGTPAVLPGPAPKENDKFPPNKTYYEIPIAIQDRSFNDDGSLFYPDARAFFDDDPPITKFVPETRVPPIWNPEFFGNMIMVNGNTWPFQTVEQRRYRLRFLNGCQSRFLILDFDQIAGVEVWQIGNEGGLLPAPVNLTANHGNRLLMSPAERADVIVDFTNVSVGNYVLGNVGPDEPFGGGVPGIDFPAADPSTTGRIMQFRVVAAAADPTTPPRFLQLPTITPLPPAIVTRRLALIEVLSSTFPNSPREALLGIVDGDPNAGPAMWTDRFWEDDVTENPAVGTTEVWEIYNATEDAHPMHIHEVAFEVVNRQNILVDEDAHTVQIDPGSDPTPPEPRETGSKDTVIAYPGQVLRLRVQFNTPGQYVWHCHILEHEDNEMMRPYRIGPEQDGQPTG